MAGMQIFWGNLTEALSGICESHYFGYKITDKTKSFSNVLFEILGLPIVVGDNNITMHQLLRLMYVDQESPTGSLFMFETFDNQITRKMVAELLMGVYDAELYDAKLTLRELQKSLSETNADIKTVKEFLPRAEESSSAFLLSMINTKENEMQQLSDLIQKRRSGLVVNIPIVNNSERLKKKIAFLRKDLEKQNDKVERIKNEIDDTELFIVALEERRKALNNSIQLRKSLDNLVLEFCPECLTQLDRNVADGHCRLCKAKSKKAREKEVYDKIREIGIYLLQHDLDRQQAFTNADDFFCGLFK